MLAPRCRRAAGDSSAGLPVAAATHPLAPSTHRLIEVLRRPVEFTPYTFGAARAVRPRAQPGPLRWPHGGVGQRSGRIILGHTQSRVLRQIPLADQAAAKPRSRRLDRTSLADADAPRPSVSSARSTSKTDSLRPHKPPDPVSTKRGQAQYPLCVNKLGFGGLPEHARCDVAFATFGAAGCRRSFGVMGGEGE